MLKSTTLFILSLFLFFSPALAASNQTYSDTFTISTYYPSPYGVYNRLEAKKALSIGNFTSAPAGLNSIFNLTEGQLFVGDSAIIKGLNSDPPRPTSKAGQIIYNSAQRMLKFFDGINWVNATAPAPPPCPIGKQCYTSNSSESCPIGQQCRAPCAACNSCCAACPTCPAFDCYISDSTTCAAGYTLKLSGNVFCWTTGRSSGYACNCPTYICCR